MIITLKEIFYLAVLTAALGYIFSGYIRYPVTHPVTRKQQWQDMKFAAMIATPAVLLHELGHKFVAMGFGLPAVFEIFWGGIALGLILKLVHSPILILAPGYVLIPQGTANLPMALIALAGPLVNLALWLGSAHYLRKHKKLRMRTMVTLMLTKKINMILFIFNMIPIPPLDGSKVFLGLFELAKAAI